MEDIIVLLWNCPDCTQLKMNISYDKAFVDTATGKNGQTLLMYYTFSNAGLKEILNKFGITETQNAPVLKKFDGEVVSDLSKIIEYMKANY